MNNLFRDPFELTGLPEYVEEYLEHNQACCISMNHRGTICAAGCMDGSVVLWDMATRGVGRTYTPHTGRVTSLRWARSGRLLVSSSADCSVVWWDVEHNKQKHRSSFAHAVVTMSVRPREPWVALVSLQQGSPQLLTVQAEGKEQTVTELPTLVIESDSKTGCSVNLAPDGLVAVAALSSCGAALFVGQPKGTLLVLRRSDLKVLDVIRLQGAPKIQALLVHKGSKLLVNCSDRTLRLYGVKQALLDAALQEELTDVAGVKKRLVTQKVPRQGSVMRGDDALLVKEREFVNAVERMPWKAACFTQDGDHVVAVPDAKGKHHLYIWNQDWGKLMRVLEGPKEGALDVSFDPSSNMLLSVGQFGKVYLWCTKRKDNWAAFAPDFKELTENEEYIEAEDEFDINEKDNKPKEEEADFDEEVDLFTPPKLQPCYSMDADEDEGDGFWHLPVEIEPSPEEPDNNGTANGTHAPSSDQEKRAAANGAGAAAAAADAHDGNAEAMDIDQP